MKSSRIFASVTVAFLTVALCTVAVGQNVGQNNATAQEGIAKVR